MRTTVVLNCKGGVAKSSTVINMAAILACCCGKRVLITDGDSQGNTTEFFGGDPNNGNLAEVLRHEGDAGAFAVVNIQPSNFNGIDLLAADDSLMDLDLTKVELGAAQAGVLRDMGKLLAEKDLYDYHLVDCPPAFNAAAVAALTAADDVIIPMKLDAFSIRGMANLIRQISNMRKDNPRLKLAGLLPTMWYKSPKIEDAEATLRASGLPVFPHIRYTKKVDDMTFNQEPLLASSPRCAAAVDYRRFVAEYLKGGAENG